MKEKYQISIKIDSKLEHAGI